MIRNSQVLIAYPILRDCKIAAELDGLPCVEDYIEMILRQALEQRPEIAELSALIEKAKKDAKKAWRDKHLPDDKLP